MFIRDENNITVLKKLKSYGVTYQRRRIKVICKKNPRTGNCKGCGRSIHKKQIKVTQIHHWFFEFILRTVRENPQLALKNTSELCFNPCHKSADALRVLTANIKPENYHNVINVAKLMPDWMQKNFSQLCRKWLKENNEY